MKISTVKFTSATNFAVGKEPFFLEAADFNKDGFSDLATVNHTGNNVSVLLGNGTGGFSTASNFSVGAKAFSLSIGDFNKDGKVDVATANYQDNNVSVLLGNGTGGFSAATNFAVGTSPLSLIATDLNNDNKVDLVAVNNGSSLSVLLGNGTGGFGAATNVTVGNYPIAVKVGYVNNDNIPDLITVNADNTNNLSVLLGNGQGGFSAATNVAVGNSPGGMVLADLNKDGKVDLATTNYKTGSLSVLLGNGNGSFGAATTFATGAKPISIIAADFDGDGVSDLVTTNMDAGNVSVLLGNGDGSFGAATNLAVGEFPGDVTVGDFNRDGRSDLAVTNRGTNNVSILLNQTNQTNQTNRAPVVANPLVAQSIISGTALNFAVAANTFTDSDAGDVLTYSAKLANNTALPTWLTFNPTTRTFAGTPSATDIGNLNITVTATDKAGLTATNSFALNVAAPTNNAPVVANPLVAQSIISGTALNFAVAANTFTDSDAGDVLTYSAKLANNTALPTWLAFNPTTRTFAGTPSATDIGNLNITVTATDKAGLTATNSFALNVAAPANNAPVVANPLVAQSIISGTALNFAVAANTFTDSDAGDVLTYSAKLANNTALPTWLTFNPTTRTFAGTPSATDIGNLNITVTATDKAGLTATNSFALNVNAPANNAPVVANPLVAQSIISGTALNFAVAANTFTDSDAGDVLTYSAKLANNTALPTWLTFNPTTRTFAGTPSATDIGNLNITVTATDKAGLTATNSFALNIAGNNLPISSGLIPGMTIDKNLFKTSESIEGFGIQVVDRKATNKVNEIGIFAVDDITGKIGSLLPGSTEYLKAALNLSQPLFTTLAGDFINLDKQEFEIDPNKTYCFFEVQDGSVADLKQQIVSGKIPTNILFSLLDSSGNSPIKLTNNPIGDGYKVSVNNDELVLNVVKLDGANVNRSIGSQSQTTPEGRTIDLTNYTGQSLKADIITKSSAAYNNHIGFYTVEDSIGSIKLSDGTFLKPGDTNYAVEAIKNAVANSLQAGKIDTKTDLSISGGKIYAPVVVAQGTLTDFVSKNPTNGGGANAIHAYFNYVGANSDKIDHFRLIGNNTFGVEDTYGGGDRDFNDLVVTMNVKTA